MSFDKALALAEGEHKAEFTKCVSLFFNALITIFPDGLIVWDDKSRDHCKVLDSKSICFEKDLDLFSNRIYFEDDYEARFLLIFYFENKKARLVINSDPIVLMVEFL